MFKNLDFKKFIVSIALCELAGILSGFFTMQNIQTWYATLQKPSFSPPNWIFAPVWTILYALMGIALYLVWVKSLKIKGRKTTAIKAFAVQLVLNASWSIVFFGFHSPFYAFINIILLLAAIIWTMVEFYKVSKTAAYLLAPYLAWVSLAALLNYSIWMLNP